MDLEGLFAFFYLLLNWRVVACLLASVLLAVGLSGMPWVSVPQLIVCAFVGIVPGVTWQAHARGELSVEKRPSSTTPIVAVTATLLLGVSWGWISSSTWASVLIGSLVLAVCAGAWLWAAKAREWFTPAWSLGLVALLIAAYAAAAIVSNAA